MSCVGLAGAAGEWAHIDRRGRILALSADLAQRLAAAADNPGNTATTFLTWSAIGSEDRLIEVLGQLRSGIPALTIPAADGRGTVAIIAIPGADGSTPTSHWQRCQPTGTMASSAHSPAQAPAQAREIGISAPQILADTAARLSHDTIAPIRRSLAFVEVVTTTDHSLSATTQHRLQRVLHDLAEASSLIRDIVATLRIPPVTTHEQLTVAQAVALGCAGAQTHGVTILWTVDESYPLPIGPDLAEPLLSAVLLVAGACASEPQWSRQGAAWTLSIATPWPAEIQAHALTLGGTIPTADGRRLRAGLYRARVIALRLGWSLTWQGNTLVLASSSPSETEITV